MLGMQQMVTCTHTADHTGPGPLMNPLQMPARSCYSLTAAHSPLPIDRTCTAAAAAAACSADSAAREAALLAAAEYAAARWLASMAAPLARMAMCARSRRLGREGSEGRDANSEELTALAGGSTCLHSNSRRWLSHCKSVSVSEQGVSVGLETPGLPAI